LKEYGDFGYIYLSGTVQIDCCHSGLQVAGIYNRITAKKYVFYLKGLDGGIPTFTFDPSILKFNPIFRKHCVLS
jgi:hypothetical protein